MAPYIIVPAAWYLCGLIGCAALWYERIHWRCDPLSPCPTPKVIVLSSFVSLLGPVTLLIGLIILGTSCEIGRDTWWNRPICQKKS